MCLSIYDEDRRLGDRERTGCWHSLDRPSIAIPQNQALVVLSVYTYEYGRLIYRLSHITMASTIDLAPCILCHSLSLSFCARTGPRSSKLRSGINWLDVWEESLLDGVLGNGKGAVNKLILRCAHPFLLWHLLGPILKHSKPYTAAATAPCRAIDKQRCCWHTHQAFNLCVRNGRSVTVWCVALFGLSFSIKLHMCLSTLWYTTMLIAHS